ncbi:hypothetical protein [Nocardiopsis algeriensis]|uniref:Uncharacterized protein n=1 Tax=Nocardiopsis algeriensis TaxID=1478215 RepID=A0A841IN89_9ACTN|nr:hypothetical protein [Nocardiopsis algeriensis]MBB6119544.1 hypothetical protein [Nocardiopsis algeriensis]
MSIDHLEPAARKRPEPRAPVSETAPQAGATTPHSRLSHPEAYKEER